jgi:hypothetical protein
MSDVSHGPGWWLASDGKWYAPESHPNYVPPPSPPPLTPPPPPKWTQAPQDSPAASSGQPTSVQQSGTGFSLASIKPLPGIVIGAGAVLALGSLLPWATVTSGFGSISVNGTSGDGDITLVFGIIGVVMGVLLVRGFVATGWLVGTGVVFLAALGVSLHDASDVSSVSNQITQDVGVNVGFGLWLCVLASIAGLAATVVLFIQRRNVEQSQRPATVYSGAPPTTPMQSPSAQPPGWWQATNGQWYPPESHPDFARPMPPRNDSAGGPL